MVADALSRIPGPELLAIALIVQQGTLLEDIKDCWNQDPSMKVLVEQLKTSQSLTFVWKNGLLLRNRKLVVGKVESQRQEIIKVFHSFAPSGHSGVLATMKRIISFCYWKG